ncbi:MAG: PKD domain-containing protein [Saprospiraceae bacterium]
MNQKFLFTIVILALFIANTYGQIVHKESFESGSYPPLGWSIKVNIPLPGTNVWVRQTNPTNPTAQAHSGSAVSRFRSRNVVSGTRQLLISPPIDYSARDSSIANFDFWMFRDSLLPTNFDSVSVWINSADSLDAQAIKLGTIARNRSIAIPDTQSANGWYHFIYTIPVKFTGATTRIIFEGISRTLINNQGANIYIDDVSYDEFPIFCTGIPNVGDILNKNKIICSGGGSASLGLTMPIVGFAGITYNWEQAITSSGLWNTIGVNSPILTIPLITATTYYRCTVLCASSNMSYVTAIDSIVIVNSVPPNVVTNVNSTSFCAGSGGVELIASGALNYIWTPSTGLSSTNGDTVIASPNFSTQYIVTGTDSSGCFDTSIVNVIVNQLPETNISVNPKDSICPGSIVYLSALPFDDVGKTYLWSNGVTSRIDTLILSQDTILSVEVKNSEGCVKSDTIELISLPLSSAKFGFTKNLNTFNFIDSSIAAGSWFWDFGDGNTSTLQNPEHTYDSAGIYKVSLVIKGLYCNDDSVSISVISGIICNDLPDVGDIVNLSPIVCEGADVTLSLSSPIIGLAGIIYTWQESNSYNGPWNNTGQNTFDLEIKSIQSTTYYRCSTTCTFSLLSYLTAVDSVLVNAAPTVVVSPNGGSICDDGSSIQLIASGALTYTWSPASGLNKTSGDTIFASPAFKTLYTITGVGQNGCIDTATVNILVNALPVVDITPTPNDTVCNKTQVILSALPVNINGFTYLWSNGIKSRRDTIIVNSDTTLSVTITNAAGCVNSDTISIISLISNFDFTSNKDSFTFINGSIHSDSWFWSFGDGTNSNLQNPTKVYTLSGDYTVTLIASNGLCSDTISKIVHVIITNLGNQTDRLKLKYYPNPVSESLNIEIENKLIKELVISNNVGQKILNYSNFTNANLISIPTHGIPSGIYFAECLVNGKLYIFKFIKE